MIFLALGSQGRNLDVRKRAKTALWRGVIMEVANYSAYWVVHQVANEVIS